jgi:type III pantothenate kinase
MLLAIDIGNTHTVFGIFDKKRLLGSWKVTSFMSRTEDELGALIDAFCKQAGVPAKKITAVGISSVVPNLTDVMERMSKKYFGATPVIISAAMPIGIKILYDDPSSVGADRLCNAVAAYAKHGGPVVIVDFGTATTFDVVSRDGEYLGGVIAPGLETSASELHRRAARLPKVELHFPKGVIGKNTVASMQAGVLYGALDAMETMVRRISKEIDDFPTVIATGGLSELMTRHSKVINKHEPNLVLEGIRLIVDRKESRKR